MTEAGNQWSKYAMVEIMPRARNLTKMEEKENFLNFSRALKYNEKKFKYLDSIFIVEMSSARELC